MKIGKILVMLVAVSSLLFIQTTQVKALEASGIIEDPVGDVYSLLTNDVIYEHQHINVDNIDITEIQYAITADTIELTMVVKGMIENRGSLEDMDSIETLEEWEFENFDVDMVSYQFIVELSDDGIVVEYSNNSLKAESGLLGDLNLSTSNFNINQNTLKISFAYNTTGQSFIEINAASYYYRFNLEELFNFDPDFDDVDSIATALQDEVPNGLLDALIFDTQDLFEVGVEIDFESQVTGGFPPYTFHWDFGDGTTSSEKNPSHIFDEAGIYQISFTVTDSQGGSVSDSYEIEILGEDTADTPGFGVLIAFIAIGFLFWFKKKE